MDPKSKIVNKSVKKKQINNLNFNKKLKLNKLDKDRPMTNIFLTWDRRKNCGGVKLVLLDPNPPPMCGQWPKTKNTNRLTVKIN